MKTKIISLFLCISIIISTFNINTLNASAATIDYYRKWELSANNGLTIIHDAIPMIFNNEENQDVMMNVCEGVLYVYLQNNSGNLTDDFTFTISSEDLINNANRAFTYYYHLQDNTTIEPKDVISSLETTYIDDKETIITMHDITAIAIDYNYLTSKSKKPILQFMTELPYKDKEDNWKVYPVTNIDIKAIYNITENTEITKLYSDNEVFHDNNYDMGNTNCGQQSGIKIIMGSSVSKVNIPNELLLENNMWYVYNLSYLDGIRSYTENKNYISYYGCLYEKINDKYRLVNIPSKYNINIKLLPTDLLSTDYTDFEFDEYNNPIICAKDTNNDKTIHLQLENDDEQTLTLLPILMGLRNHFLNFNISLMNNDLTKLYVSNNLLYSVTEDNLILYGPADITSTQNYELSSTTTGIDMTNMNVTIEKNAFTFLPYYNTCNLTLDGKTITQKDFDIDSKEVGNFKYFSNFNVICVQPDGESGYIYYNKSMHKTFPDTTIYETLPEPICFTKMQIDPSIPYEFDVEFTDKEDNDSFTITIENKHTWSEYLNEYNTSIASLNRTIDYIVDNDNPDTHISLDETIDLKEKDEYKFTIYTKKIKEDTIEETTENQTTETNIITNSEKHTVYIHSSGFWNSYYNRKCEISNGVKWKDAYSIEYYKDYDNKNGNDVPIGENHIKVYLENTYIRIGNYVCTIGKPYYLNNNEKIYINGDDIVNLTDNIDIYYEIANKILISNNSIESYKLYVYDTEKTYTYISGQTFREVIKDIPTKNNDNLIGISMNYPIDIYNIHSLDEPISSSGDLNVAFVYESIVNKKKVTTTEKLPMKPLNSYYGLDYGPVMYIYGEKADRTLNTYIKDAKLSDKDFQNADKLYKIIKKYKGKKIFITPKDTNTVITDNKKFKKYKGTIVTSDIKCVDFQKATCALNIKYIKYLGELEIADYKTLETFTAVCTSKDEENGIFYGNEKLEEKMENENIDYYNLSSGNTYDNFLQGYFLPIDTSKFLRLEERSNHIDQTIDQIIKEADLNSNTTITEAIEKLNKWYLKNFSYDEWYQIYELEWGTYESQRERNAKPGKYHGVCDAYSTLTEAIFAKCGVYCPEICSNPVDNYKETCAHAFNSIKINNQTYYLDYCWSDSNNPTSLYVLPEEMSKYSCHRLPELSDAAIKTYTKIKNKKETKKPTKKSKLNVDNIILYTPKLKKATTYNVGTVSGRQRLEVTVDKAKSIKYNYEIKMVSKTKTKITNAENISTNKFAAAYLSRKEAKKINKIQIRCYTYNYLTDINGNKVKIKVYSKWSKSIKVQHNKTK